MRTTVEEPEVLEWNPSAGIVAAPGLAVPAAVLEWQPPVDQSTQTLPGATVHQEGQAEGPGDDEHFYDCSEDGPDILALYF